MLKMLTRKTWLRMDTRNARALKAAGNAGFKVVGTCEMVRNNPKGPRKILLKEDA